MKKWKQILTAFALMAGMSVTVAPVNSVGAINVFNECSGNASAVCKASGTDEATDLAKVIINTLLFLLSIIAVIMIIVGGVKYTASNGDASRIKAAKDTITYSIAGLVVALLAFAIVNFIVGRIV